MEWLFIAGLAVWILVIQIRLASTERRLKILQNRRESEAAPGAAISAPRPPIPTARSLEALQSTPTISVAPSPVPEPVVASEPTTAAATQETPPAPRPSPVRPALSKWLSENGLAWLGGVALALGGALLVAYAAERGFFTPTLRIVASIVLGFAMLAAGEWIRRQTRAPGGRHGLAAAVTSGAGASTLYAAIWAAYALYHFLPLPTAAALLAAISLGLLALAVLHGEALALLAIVGAFAAPVLCNQANWSGVALDGYLALVTATGLAATSLRGWSRSGVMTLASVALWILSRQSGGDAMGAGGLLVAALAMTLLAVRRRDMPSAPEPSVARPAASLMSSLPTITCVGASVLWALFLGVFFLVHRAGDPLLALALVGGALSLLCAAAVRMGLAPARVILGPAVALVLIAAARSDFAGIAPISREVLWLLAPIVALAGSALALRLVDRGRADVGVIGAAAAALALTLLRAPLVGAAPGEGSLLFVAAAALFLTGAAMIARRSTGPAGDLALAAWIGAGAEAVGLAIHTGLAGRPEPLAYGLLALVLALTSRRLPWRGLPEAAALACLVSLLSLFGPQIAGATFAGRLAWTDLALAGGAGVLAQAVSWWILRGRAGSGVSAEAASTSALVSGLLTAFLVLHIWATPHGALPAPLDPFTEAALRTVLLVTAGLVLSVRGGPNLFSRARGPVFLALGALHGLLLGVLVLNPWWGFGLVKAIPGPPVVDALALAFLAPALMLAQAARLEARTRGDTKTETWAAPWTALAALLFLVAWAIMEIRRLFHGPALAAGAYGYTEVAAYGLAALGVAWLVSLSDGRIVAAGKTAGTARAGLVARWVGLVVSAYLLCLVASPWWGPLQGSFATPLLFFALFAVTVALTAPFARREPNAGPAFGEAIKVAVTLEAFTLLTLVIRFAFHGAAMRTPLREASVETWTFSAAWAVYGLIILVAGARSGDRTLRWLGLGVLVVTTLKVFLFDMATLEGVIRAASFLALGALLLIAAIAARRLGAKARPSP